MGISGNGNKGDGKMGMGMQCWNENAENGNGNDLMGVGREWEQESHSRTPLFPTSITRSAGRPQPDPWTSLTFYGNG